MSNVKKPMAGEWWEIASGFRVRIIGRKLDGIFLCEEMGGKVNRFDIKNAHWNHLPDCDSFEWKPEVFPQYWTTLNRESKLPESAAFVIRTNKINWNIVWKNGDNGIAMGAVSKWSPSGRTQITKEQAEALLLPKESPDDWVVQDRVPARAGIDERRFTTVSTGYMEGWNEVKDSWSAGLMHGSERGGQAVEVRCRRKDLPHARTVTIIRWLCWNEDGKERIVQAANRPTGFLNCLNVGEEKFEVSL
jgi:hypothetical protein